MKKKYSLRFIVLMLLGFGLALPIKLAAQTACSQQLAEAQKQFDAGHPEKALVILEGCITLGGFSKAELERALRLTTIIHLAEQDGKAEESFLQLLELNPDFEVDTTFRSDPADLVYLYESVRTNPLFYVRFMGGINGTSVQEGETFTVGNSFDEYYGSKDYFWRAGFQIGGDISMPLGSRNLRLSLGVYYSNLRYFLRNDTDLFGVLTPDDFPDKLDDLDASGFANTPYFFRLELEEIQSYLQLPIKLHYDFDRISAYNFDRKRVVPYVEAGVTLQGLMTARYPEIIRFNGNRNTVSSSNFEDIIETRNRFNYSLNAGTGLRAKIGKNYLVVGIEYQFFFRNTINPDWRYSDDVLVYQFGHVDSDFRFRTWAFSLGYEFPLYKHNILTKKN